MLRSQPISRRSAGVLLHMTSLPSPFGIGDLGPLARQWIDRLHTARLEWWQMLPLNPPAAGNSPYQCFSAFAGNPLLISPEDLYRDGLLHRSDLDPAITATGTIQFARVVRQKSRILDCAGQHFSGASKAMKSEFDQFCAEQADWLDDYALFMAVRQQQGHRPWIDWPADLALHRLKAVAAFKREHAELVRRQKILQFLFFRQLRALHACAGRKGVGLIGDLPIFVAYDSADVWANPQWFALDRHRRPKYLTGAAPDSYSRIGQLWGNPHYNWAAMKRDGYRWWIRRLHAALEGADYVRIDHFRGFAQSWQVPAGARTAQHGRWIDGPGIDLFHALRDALGHLPLIAEDLGVITPDVVALRDELGLPGMRVIQFGFQGSSPDSLHLPHLHSCNALVYTGTHDNDTTAGWYRRLGPNRQYFWRYAPGARHDPVGEMMRMAFASVACCAVVPMQDVLRLGSRARMNIPGTPDSNWRWQMTPAQWTPHVLNELAELAMTYGRAAPRMPGRAGGVAPSASGL